jgi:DNA-binding MarR family transcriptional regulator
VDDGDRRLVRHYLTPAAEELVGELERTGREEFYAIFRELRPDQLERLIAALRDLATASEAAEARHETEKASVA